MRPMLARNELWAINGARDKSYSDITNVNSIPAFVVANAMFSYEEPTLGDFAECE
jgi:hypothetical protein